jgi:uncharacterized membrane protein YphA (DoxX/SURF4 family)
MPQLLRLIQILQLLVPLALLAFWAWMFWDMTQNDTLANNEKYTWTFAFVYLSIFSAGLYYIREYRNRR